MVSGELTAKNALAQPEVLLCSEFSSTSFPTAAGITRPWALDHRPAREYLEKLRRSCLVGLLVAGSWKRSNLKPCKLFCAEVFSQWTSFLELIERAGQLSSCSST